MGCGSGAGTMSSDVMRSGNQTSEMLDQTSEVLDKVPTPQPPAPTPQPPAPCCPNQVLSQSYVDCCIKCAKTGFDCKIETCDCSTFSSLNGGSGGRCSAGGSSYR